MPDLDDDEIVFIAFAILFIALVGLPEWIGLFRVGRFGRRNAIRDAVLSFPFIALLPTCIVLLGFADPQVKGHTIYIALFLIGTLAWQAAAPRAMPLLGISLRDDAVERNNAAAMLCAIGWHGGVGIVYAGANIGTGPTIWTTLLPAVAGGAALFVCWLIIDRIGGVAEAVTIDRDLATGWRMLGTMIGVSLILAKAVAGDWHSWPGTWQDFLHAGWPAVLLAIIAGVLQRVCRPTPRDPQPSAMRVGLLPACLMVLASVAIVLIAANIAPAK